MHRTPHSPTVEHGGSEHHFHHISSIHTARSGKPAGVFSSLLHNPAWKLTLLTLLVAQWYIFSYLFNASLKVWFGEHNGSDTLFPLLFTIFLANTAATGLWTLHSYGWVGCDVLGGSCLTQLVFEHQTDFVLLCASGIMGVAATCVVLQFGSIQLVQVRRGF